MSLFDDFARTDHSCSLYAETPYGCKPNLTFDRVRSSLSPAPTAAQSTWLNAKVLEIESAVAALREHRNKRPAHLDLPNALSDISTLPAFSRQHIEDALKAMRELMNQIMNWNNAGESHFYPHSVGGADALIGYLQQAERLGELQDDYYLRRLPVEAIIEKLSLRQVPAI